jgi:hypothetical protein
LLPLQASSVCVARAHHPSQHDRRHQRPSIRFGPSIHIRIHINPATPRGRARGREREREAERGRESQQPQPHPLPIIDVEQPLLNMSLCNIDGLVLFGRMPTFCQVDPGSINLNHLRVCLMDINTLPDKKFHSAKLVQFTYSCGIPVMVATDLDLASLCRNILQYLAKAQPGEAEMENNWIVVSNDSIEAIEMALIFNGKDKLRIDQKFWDTFSAYVETIMHASEDLYSHPWI